MFKEKLIKFHEEVQLEGSDLTSAEHKLLTAVLYSAIKDSFSSMRGVRREAIAWLEGSSDSPPPYMSFEYICDNLEIGDKCKKKLLKFIKTPRTRENRRYFLRLCEFF